MKSAVVIATLLGAALLARFAQARTITKNSQKQDRPSERERSHSTMITSRAQLTNENITEPAIHPESNDLGEPRVNFKNGDQSYILAPVRGNKRGQRNSEDLPNEDEDPPHVMSPFQEIKKGRDFHGNSDSNVALTNGSDVLGPDLKKERRKRREVSKRANWPLKKKMAKRRPRALLVRMSPNEMIDFDGSLLGEALEKYAIPKTNNVSVDHTDKKSKNSLVMEFKSHLHPEMFDGLHQKDKSDSTPQVLQAVVAKPKKSPVNPINITMFITNLIPPNEVENTRITNVGKLYKSGCLKFSIQLDRPEPCSCPPDDTGFDNAKPTWEPCLTQKVACHAGGAGDKGKPVAASSSLPGNSPFKCGTKPQRGNAETGADPARRSDPSSNKEVLSLLLQLIGTDKKLLKKPATTSGQTILMDSDLQELRRLFSSVAGSKASEPTGKSMSAKSPPAVPITLNSQRAKAIAKALNLFSKYAYLKQNSRLAK